MRPYLALLLLAACGSGTDLAPDAAPDCPDTGLDMQSSGDPRWCVVDGLLFSSRADAPIEDALRETADAVLVDHTWDSFANHYLPASTTPHDPPYDHEASDGVAAIGRDVKTSFTTGEATAPFAIFGMVMLVPDARSPIGHTYDGDPMPLIIGDHSWQVDEQLWLLDGDVLVDSGQTTVYGSAPPYQGVSHMPIIWVEQADTPSPGSYRVDLSIEDHEGASWSVSLPFTVE